MRVGIGYDVHRLISGRELILGGVKIDYHLGLDGHSDADVLCHALMDALLGAAALGDIGELFPADNNLYNGADSIKLLREVMSKIRAAGYEPANADIVICAEAPTLQPYRLQMQKNLAAAMTVKTAQIGVKATTTEGLGFEGRGEGISAQAIVLLTDVV